MNGKGGLLPNLCYVCAPAEGCISRPEGAFDYVLQLPLAQYCVPESATNRGLCALPGASVAFKDVAGGTLTL